MGKVRVIPSTINPLTHQSIVANVKRKVAAYARVSTDSDEQYTSYEAQVNYYTGYIQSRVDWEYINVYADEGISGTNTKKRVQFNKMIEDALEGKINLIITKSISRFARNTLDTISYIRKLKAAGVEVFFEKENLWTFDSKSEMVLSMLAAIAQEESRSISENVKIGKRWGFKEGKVSMPYKIFLGYDKVDGKMDIVVANPPFSANWDPNSTMEKDDRFSGAGKLAPKSYADYAFVEHMVNSLSANGCMAVVLPHGPLFRGNAEGVIRQYLVETRNYLDTVIGLPENLFYGTTIAACICVFKKNKTDRNVYFIDASKYFEKGKNQNILRDEDIQRIMDAYASKKDIDKYAHLASIEELQENEFNLNIPRYVDTFEEEEEIDLNEVMAEYHRLDEEDKKITEELNKYLEELGLPKF
jgi:DNA invertase Pin-like site-specific DNA recombinase